MENEVINPSEEVIAPIVEETPTEVSDEVVAEVLEAELTPEVTE